MKNFLVFAAMLAASLTAYSQATTGSDAMESQIKRGLLDSRNHSLITPRVEKANEIQHGRVNYSGVFVQFAKSDSKLQLINPAAPQQYGSGRANLVVDPSPALRHSTREGLNLFSIGF